MPPVEKPGPTGVNLFPAEKPTAEKPTGEANHAPAEEAMDGEVRRASESFHLEVKTGES